MSDDPKEGLFLKIGPIQAAAHGRLPVFLLAALVALLLIGRALHWW